MPHLPPRRLRLVFPFLALSLLGLVPSPANDPDPACSGFDTFDLNGVVADGCEFALDSDAIYVSSSNPSASDAAGCGRGPTGTGPSNQPCATMRDVAATSTTLVGSTSGSPHTRTVTAQSITTPTTFEGFVVYGATNGTAGGNSYALWIVGSDSDLVVADNRIVAGRGGDGAAGSTGGGGVGGAGGSGGPAMGGVSGGPGAAGDTGNANF